MAANKSSLSVLFMALVLMALASELADASALTVWSGPGCNNKAERYMKCGCSNIKLRGGYEFVYTGQSAAVYNQGNCKGVAHHKFHGGARQCDPFGWKSMFIQC